MDSPEKQDLVVDSFDDLMSACQDSVARRLLKAHGPVFVKQIDALDEDDREKLFDVLLEEDALPNARRAQAVAGQALRALDCVQVVVAIIECDKLNIEQAVEILRAAAGRNCDARVPSVLSTEDARAVRREIERQWPEILKEVP